MISSIFVRFDFSNLESFRVETSVVWPFFWHRQRNASDVVDELVKFIALLHFGQLLQLVMIFFSKQHCVALFFEHQTLFNKYLNVDSFLLLLHLQLCYVSHITCFHIILQKLFIAKRQQTEN